MQQLLRTINIGQDRFEQACPLDQAVVEPVAFLGREDERNRVELPGPSQAARIAEDVVRNAILTDEFSSVVPALSKLVQPKPFEMPEKLLPVIPRPSVGGTH